MPFYTYDYERLSRAAARLREERWRCHAPIEAFAVTEDDGTVGARPPREPGGGQKAQILRPGQLGRAAVRLQRPHQLQIPPPQKGKQAVGGGQAHIYRPRRIAPLQQRLPPCLQRAGPEALVHRKVAVQGVYIPPVGLQRSGGSAFAGQLLQIVLQLFRGQLQLQRKPSSLPLRAHVHPPLSRCRQN